MVPIDRQQTQRQRLPRLSRLSLNSDVIQTWAAQRAHRFAAGFLNDDGIRRPAEVVAVLNRRDDSFQLVNRPARPVVMGHPPEVGPPAGLAVLQFFEEPPRLVVGRAHRRHVDAVLVKPMGENRVGHMFGTEKTLRPGEDLDVAVKRLVDRRWVFDMNNEISKIPMRYHQSLDDLQPGILEAVTYDGNGLVYHRPKTNIFRPLISRSVALTCLPQIGPRYRLILGGGWPVEEPIPFGRHHRVTNPKVSFGFI